MCPDAVHKNREQQEQQARLELAEPCADVFWIDVWFVCHLNYLISVPLYLLEQLSTFTQRPISSVRVLLSWSA